MLNRDPEREAPRRSRRTRWATAVEDPLANEGLAAFRRAYRWLNLTLVHQGLWPLVLVVFTAPAVPIGLTEGYWFLVRLAGPLLAALLAFAYLSQRPESSSHDVGQRALRPGGERDRRLREQATILIVGVTVAVALLRLMQGPVLPVAKLELFAAADVAAYQAINFGVVGRGAAPGWGRLAPIGLFALSWGLHDLFLAMATRLEADLVLTLAGGMAIGLVAGAVSWLLRWWPGGYLCAVAMQVLVVYLVLGFLG